MPYRSASGRFLDSATAASLGINEPKTTLGGGLKPLASGGGIFKSAAVAVLRLERKLMTTGDITKVALEKELINCQGKTPDATMASALYTDVKRKPETSVFTRPEEGLFGLREWEDEGFVPEVAQSSPVAAPVAPVTAQPKRIRSPGARVIKKPKRFANGQGLEQYDDILIEDPNLGMDDRFNSGSGGALRLLGDVCLNQGSSDSPHAPQTGRSKEYSGSTSPASKSWQADELALLAPFLPYRQPLHALNDPNPWPFWAPPSQPPTPSPKKSRSPESALPVRIKADPDGPQSQRERMRPEPLQLDQSTAGHSRESHGRPGSSTPETAAQRLGSMPDGLHTLHEAAISPIGLAPLPTLSNSPSIDSSKRRKKPKLSVDLPQGEQLKVEEGEEGTQINSTTPNIMAIYSALQTPRIGLTPIPSPTPVPAASAAPTYTSVGVGTNTAPGHMLPLSPSCFGNLDTPNLINLPLPDVELTSHEEFAELQLHTGHTPQQPGLLQASMPDLYQPRLVSTGPHPALKSNAIDRPMQAVTLNVGNVHGGYVPAPIHHGLGHASHRPPSGVISSATSGARREMHPYGKCHGETGSLGLSMGQGQRALALIEERVKAVEKQVGGTDPIQAGKAWLLLSRAYQSESRTSPEFKAKAESALLRAWDFCSVCFATCCKEPSPGCEQSFSYLLKRIRSLNQKPAEDIAGTLPSNMVPLQTAS
ncbi:hypothetical protein WJX74_003971 [Apatococcus lobatus]|uniref:HTH HARE-type domain-containing protein n=1 Tax=Apatococcus lobatus TaxID=904363 RepID=A0AAW1Q8E9_9CHLO